MSLQEVPASESFGANVANVLRISVQILEMGLVTSAVPKGLATKLAIDFLQDVNTLHVTDEFALDFEVLAARVANERFQLVIDTPASSFESIVVQLSGGFDSIDAGFCPFEDDLRRQPLQYHKRAWERFMQRQRLRLINILVHRLFLDQHCGETIDDLFFDHLFGETIDDLFFDERKLEFIFVQLLIQSLG